MDQELRLSERDGSVNLLLRYRAGLISHQTMKRLAVCGNTEAATILGFRKKVKPHLIAVIKVMIADCPQRVWQVINRRIGVLSFTASKRTPSYKWMRHPKRGPGVFSRSEQHFIIARSLVGHGMPGFWWVGREMCKLGRVL